MAFFEKGDLKIHYDDRGDGPPVLLLAPGGMRSAAPLWERAPFDPRVVLADGFRVITMDQRNAGQSVGPVTADDGWHIYAADQLALLDHLGVERCHVLGMCIGGPFCLELMRRAPERILSGVLLQPIGFDDNREVFFELFDGWAETLPQQPPRTALDAFRENMFGGTFTFNLGRDEVAGIATPMLILRGDDPYHPAATSEALAETAPQAELIRAWKEEPALSEAVERVRGFLQAHS